MSSSEPRYCKYPDCVAVVAARGWCKRHYDRWRKHGDPSVVLRPGGFNGAKPAARMRRWVIVATDTKGGWRCREEVATDADHAMTKYRGMFGDRYRIVAVGLLEGSGHPLLWQDG